jgi:hypothetical protein
MKTLDNLTASNIVDGIFSFSKYTQFGEEVLNSTLLKLRQDFGILENAVVECGSNGLSPYIDAVDRVMSNSITWNIIRHFDYGNGWCYAHYNKSRLETRSVLGPLELEASQIDYLKEIIHKFDKVANSIASEHSGERGYLLK